MDLLKLFHKHKVVKGVYMGNLVQELEDKFQAVENALAEAKNVVTAAKTDAPAAEQVIVEAVIAALEAQGYTVTPPAKQIDVKDGDAADGEQAGEDNPTPPAQ